MAYNMSSNTTSTKTAVPEARQALNNMKFEIASELGVNLKQGYNGDLTSRDAGSVGGYMVKNVMTVRSVKFERTDRIVEGQKRTVRYVCALGLGV